jgi:hypothetical protein
VSETGGKAEPKGEGRTKRGETPVLPNGILAHPHRKIETVTLRPERRLIYRLAVSIFHQARQHVVVAISGWLEADIRLMS